MLTIGIIVLVCRYLRKRGVEVTWSRGFVRLRRVGNVVK